MALYAVSRTSDLPGPAAQIHAGGSRRRQIRKDPGTCRAAGGELPQKRQRPVVYPRHHQIRRHRQTARKTPAEGIRGLPEDQGQAQDLPHRSHPHRLQKALGRKELRRHRRCSRPSPRVRHPGRSQPLDVLRPRLDESVIHRAISL